jgi:ADP-heptose:LPS heptosyltransferase
VSRSALVTNQPINQSTSHEILVIKPSSLGDVVHTLPAVALVKKRWPSAHLRWLINPEWAPLLEGNPHVDEVVIFPRGEFRGVAGWAKIPTWAKTMAARKSDLVLDFQGLLRSVLIGRLCRSGDLIGLSDAREGARYLYDRTADVRGIAHAVDRYLAMVSVLGIDLAPPLEWPLPQGSAPAGFADAAPFVLLHPFSRGAGKSLTPTDVAAFCRALAPVPVVIAGRSDEQVAPLDNITDLLNRTTLPELIWLIRKAAFTVSVDSGPMHIAAALTPRLLSIHTWSDPRKVGPYQPDAWVWKDGALFQMKNLAVAPAHQPAHGIAEVARFVSAML